MTTPRGFHIISGWAIILFLAYAASNDAASETAPAMPALALGTKAVNQALSNYGITDLIHPSKLSVDDVAVEAKCGATVTPGRGRAATCLRQHVRSTQQKLNLTIMTTSASVALLFGQCD